jgi:hypothetical protein
MEYSIYGFYSQPFINLIFENKESRICLVSIGFWGVGSAISNRRYLYKRRKK